MCCPRRRSAVAPLQGVSVELNDQQKAPLTEHGSTPADVGALAASAIPTPWRLNTPGTGVGQLYVAGLKVQVAHVDRDCSEEASPLHDSLAGFRETFADKQDVLSRMLNKVKVCSNCGKPCGYTTTVCNSCGSSIEEVPVSHTDNIFMGFVHGVGAGRFPFKISIRKQTPELIVFDDPLAVSVVHLNVIPTSTYIPDLRFLFADPARGLELLNKMYTTTAEACIESFWRSEAFRKQYFKDQPIPESPADVLKAYPFVCGMNFPPSQFQLHLQFIHAPLLPFHYALLREQKHFDRGRFFPLEYLRAALARGDAVKTVVTDDTDIQELISKVEALGISYDAAHQEMIRGIHSTQAKFSPWKEEDFEVQVINGKAYSTESAMPLPDKDPKAVQKEDTFKLQSYGRPYQDGKPSGTYYKYAKQPHEVAAFP